MLGTPQINWFGQEGAVMKKKGNTSNNSETNIHNFPDFSESVNFSL